MRKKSESERGANVSLMQCLLLSIAATEIQLNPIRSIVVVGGLLNFDADDPLVVLVLLLVYAIA